MNDSPDILIIDTGGGKLGTITKRAWHILAVHGAQSSISGYPNQGPPKTCPIVNAITKVTFPDWDDPVLFIMNYVTLIDDDNEFESLCVPFSLMQHGIAIDMIPTT